MLVITIEGPPGSGKSKLCLQLEDHFKVEGKSTTIYDPAPDAIGIDSHTSDVLILTYQTA